MGIAIATFELVFENYFHFVCYKRFGWLNKVTKTGEKDCLISRRDKISAKSEKIIKLLKPKGFPPITIAF
jgi:hypothetical protein